MPQPSKFPKCPEGHTRQESLDDSKLVDCLVRRRDGCRRARSVERGSRQAPPLLCSGPVVLCSGSRSDLLRSGAGPDLLCSGPDLLRSGSGPVRDRLRWLRPGCHGSGCCRPGRCSAAPGRGRSRSAQEGPAGRREVIACRDLSARRLDLSEAWGWDLRASFISDGRATGRKPRDPLPAGPYARVPPSRTDQARRSNTRG